MEATFNRLHDNILQRTELFITSNPTFWYHITNNSVDTFIFLHNCMWKVWAPNNSFNNVFFLSLDVLQCLNLTDWKIDQIMQKITCFTYFGQFWSLQNSISFLQQRILACAVCQMLQSAWTWFQPDILLTIHIQDTENLIMSY